MEGIEQAVALGHTSEHTSAHDARAWLQFAAIAVLLAFLYSRILGALAKVWWSDPNFSHGFFVPLFAAYVLWVKRQEIARTEIRPSWWGLPVVVLASGLLVVGNLGAELFLSRTSLVLLLAGLVLLLAGVKFLRAVLFPLLFLLLMVPLPAIIFNQVTFPLQLLASEFAALVLPLFGVPVLREGNVINLPAMPLEVAEACSGIRSLISLETLALIYGYLLEPRMWRRVALALAAVPIAVFANSMRIVGTGLAVQYWDPEKALGFFHEFSGWVIFIVSLLALFAFHNIIRRRGAKREVAALKQGAEA